MSISAYGNKQVNVRFDSELLEKIQTAADKEEVGLQDWIRNACKSALGESIPGAVGRSEFQEALAKLQSEIEDLKKLELPA